MSRNFDNFIGSYFSYANDGWAPSQYHLWVACSIVAASLERKVWIEFDKSRSIFPNIFVFLVAIPGAGKSSSIDDGVNILSQVKNKNGEGINFISEQITEAAIFKDLNVRKEFSYNGNKYEHHSGYYVSDEGSFGFKEIGADTNISALTKLYDCGTLRRSTLKHGKSIIPSTCLNLLTGCTFDHLPYVIHESGIGGGFASRVVYVVQEGKHARPFQELGNKDSGLKSIETSAKLVEDLTRIHNLAGPFELTKEFKELRDEWVRKNEEYMMNIRSDSLRAILSRLEINILKSSMIMSASASDDLILKPEHWTMAKELVEEAKKNISTVITCAYDRKNQKHVNNMAIQIISKNPTLNAQQLVLRLVGWGVYPRHAEDLIRTMIASKAIVWDPEARIFSIRVNPDDYL